MEIIIPRQWTRRDILKAAEHPGRKVGGTAGSYISDLASLRKVILLCEFCQGKFKPKPHRYRIDKRWFSTSRCDGCKAVSPHCTIFVPEETFNLVTEDPAVRRAKSRAAWKERPVASVATKG